MMMSAVVLGAGVCLGLDAGVSKSSRLLVEVELLEFLLRLTEVLLVSVDDTLAFPLPPFLREESVQTVWRAVSYTHLTLPTILLV